MMIKKDTNFTMLDTIIKLDENNNISKWNLGISSRNIRNYKILKSFVLSLEDYLYKRQYSDKKLIFRNICELINLFVYNEIILFKTDEVSSERRYAYSSIKDEWNNIRKKSDLNSEKWSIYHFFKSLRNLDFINYDEYEELKYFVKIANSEVHIIDDTKMEEQIKGIFVEERFILNPIKYDEFIGMLEKLQLTLKIIFKNLYPDLKFNEEFDDQIYFDGTDSLIELKNYDEFINLIGQECVICNSGKLFMPKRKNLPNGPFLICDNKDCWSMLSSNLNLKQNKGELFNCSNPDCDGVYKKTASYNKEAENYKKPYLQCNHCKEFGE